MNTQLDKNGLDENGYCPMTKAQYAKIHSDFKGNIDGNPTALKNINGATTIVFIKFI